MSRTPPHLHGKDQGEEEGTVQVKQEKEQEDRYPLYVLLNSL